MEIVVAMVSMIAVEAGSKGGRTHSMDITKKKEVKSQILSKVK